MSMLINLERLDLSYQNFISDALLEAISQNCKKLTYLNLSYCPGITDRGVSSVCNIDKLTYLSLRESKRIRNPPLEKLTSLIVLDAYESVLEEECLCIFLKKADRLRALNVAKCPLITNNLLDVAIEVAKTRNSNNQLDLYIAETGIDMNSLDEQPSFLNITSSLCMELSMDVTGYGIKDPFMCPFTSMKDRRNIRLELDSGDIGSGTKEEMERDWYECRLTKKWQQI
ncbi:F-box/LRR-repeat protein 20-like [Belonocnema kinseyi]|uniref:F-box/LRR-repeat protein 20-like n=1 Tax=Belonocnema kinseyi TaxID=2817044 RepID=UPI00143CD417|nr:F-box/LRR-repeat protein 20-like [Belonocnema kinseyi]